MIFCVRARFAKHMFCKVMFENLLRDTYIRSKYSEGEQNMLPQNMSLWHIGYFELKLLKKQPVQEGYFPPLSPESRK